MSADEADAPHGGPFAHACAATLAPDLSAEAGTPRAGGSGAALAAALRRPAPYKLAAGEEPAPVLSRCAGLGPPPLGSG